MAKKCDMCGNKIEVTFLGKIRGTEIKKRFVCSTCQSKYGNELKKKLGVSAT